MNERIKELYVKALSEAMEMKTATAPIFAELIIRECAKQCQHLGDMDRITAHFGLDPIQAEELNDERAN